MAKEQAKPTQPPAQSSKEVRANPEDGKDFTIGAEPAKPKDNGPVRPGGLDDGPDVAAAVNPVADHYKAEAERLKAENDALRRQLVEARMDDDDDDRPRAAAPAPPAEPGDGSHRWRGRLDKDPTAPVVLFRTTSEEPAVAREDYKRHAGITSTDKAVVVEKLDDANGH